MYSYSNPPTQPRMELKVNLIYRTELELVFWMKSLQIILSRVSVGNIPFYKGDLRSEIFICFLIRLRCNCDIY